MGPLSIADFHSIVVEWNEGTVPKSPVVMHITRRTNDGLLVAMAQATTHVESSHRTTAILKAFAVQRPYRRFGVGRELLRACNDFFDAVSWDIWAELDMTTHPEEVSPLPPMMAEVGWLHMGMDIYYRPCSRSTALD